jgi:hypothetical protein
MTVQEVEQYVTNRVNALSTNLGANLSKDKIVEAFNAQQLLWAESRFKLDGLNRTRMDEIQYLLTTLKDESLAKDDLGFYTYTLPEDYFHYERAYCFSGNCPIYLHQRSEADASDLLLDDHWKPSKTWQETFCTLVGNKLKIYADFSLTRLQFIYYRLPLSINMEWGSPDVNGDTPTDVDPELTGSSLYEVLNMTVMALSGAIGNMPAYQIADKQNKEYT